MLTRTPRTPDLQELEALWELPARRRQRVTPDVAAEMSGTIARALAIAWPVLLFALVAFEPAPRPGATVPVWSEVLSNGLLLAVLGGIIARVASGPRNGLAFFSAAGALGIAVGVGCRASAHHAGSWWLVETALFSVLAVTAWAGLALTRRAGA
jgi:hypothetical protein